MIETSRRFLDKAAHSIHGAEALLHAGESDSAVARSYYAMFYCAEARLSERGLRFRRHSAVHAAFGEHFVKTAALDIRLHRWLLDAFDLRIQGDYSIDAEVNAESAVQLIEQAREFLDQTRRYLENEGPS